jgi:hypothetical protein
MSEKVFLDTQAYTTFWGKIIWVWIFMTGKDQMKHMKRIMMAQGF